MILILSTLFPLFSCILVYKPQLSLGLQLRASKDTKQAAKINSAGFGTIALISVRKPLICSNQSINLASKSIILHLHHRFGELTCGSKQEIELRGN